MKIIILTQYFPPETGAPQNRLSDLARRLSDMGHQITVLTAKPNYPTGVIFPDHHRYLWKGTIEDDIQVIRCWLYPSRSRHIILRLLNYFSFVFSSALIGAFALPRAEIMIVESPPIFLGLSAWWLSRLKGCRLVFNVADLYPATAIELGFLRNSLLQRIFFAFEAWCYRIAHLVSGQTQSIINDIIQRFPDQPTHLLTNGIAPEQFPQCPPQPTPESFIVGYAGILGHAQRLDKIIECAAILREHPDIRFEIYGDGPLREPLMEQAHQAELANVHFKGHRSRTEILDSMKSWGAAVITLQDSPTMRKVQPSKLFEAMGCGLPIILSAPDGEATKALQAARAGIVTPPEDPSAVANAILKLADDRSEAQQMGRHGYTYVMEHYNRAKVAQAFAHRLEALLSDDSP